MKNQKAVILINSTDKYSDCWPIFFYFFNKYWKNCSYQIYLNTENLSYVFNNKDISTKIGKNFSSKSWSCCLNTAIDLIDSKYIIYFQEDYFINNKVNESEIDKLLIILDNNPNIGLAELTLFGSVGPFEKCNKLINYVCVSKESQYRISCQASIWRKSYLKKILQTHENGWLFEIFGTMRSRNLPDKIIALNREVFSDPIISYEHTGIIKNKWNTNVIPLIHEFDSNFDLTSRGIYTKKSKLKNKIETLYFLIQNPLSLLKSIYKSVYIHAYHKIK